MNSPAVSETFPFGNNLHFVYHISAARFIFIHPELAWAIEPGQDAAELASKITDEGQSHLKDLFAAVTAGKFSGKTTIKLKRNQQDRWLDVVPFLSEYEGEPVITGSVTDISAEMTNQLSINKYADKKNAILQMLGHDLKGPLGIAGTLVAALKKELEEPALLKKASLVAEILQQSVEMISDLVKKEFLETTSTELVRDELNIVEVIQNYFEQCKRAEGVTAINFELFSSSPVIYLRFDRVKFMQVVNNLVSNALKFTHPGGSFSIHIEDAGDSVQFRFTDTGIGIPEEMQPFIFEKYSPARRPGLLGEPSVGLGLSIVKTIIDWHNGKITCQSEPGKGTTFYIILQKE